MESMQVYKIVINYSEDFSGVCYNISFLIFLLLASLDFLVLSCWALVKF